MSRGENADGQNGRSTFAAAAKQSWHYTPTGVEGFDKVLGGGLVTGCSILLGGFRGAGKSTLLCEVAASVAERKGSALYASSEEGIDGVLSIAHRMGLTTDRVEVLAGQSSIEDVIKHAEQKKPFLTIFDSLQKFASDFAGGSPGSLVQDKAVCVAVSDYVKRTRSCAIIVNQMDKAGELKGGTDAAHAVEVVLVLAFTKGDDEDAPSDGDDVRVLLCDGKNRRGPDNIRTYWTMSEQGRLVELPPKSRIKSR